MEVSEEKTTSSKVDGGPRSLGSGEGEGWALKLRTRKHSLEIVEVVRIPLLRSHQRLRKSVKSSKILSSDLVEEAFEVDDTNEIKENGKDMELVDYSHQVTFV